MTALKSILFFLTAGLLEIAGGYLIWIWIKNDKPLWYGLTGILWLALYGFIPTLQTSHFGRIRALSCVWSGSVSSCYQENKRHVG
jgi:small multidrug resistance family-3 protein